MTIENRSLALHYPREQLRQLGPSSLSTRDLLAVVLGTGVSRIAPLTLADRVLFSTGGLVGMSRMPYFELASIPGVGEVKAAQIQAMLDLTRRMAMELIIERPIVRSAADVVPLLMPDVATLEQEHLRALLLDVRNRVIGQQEVYKGSLNTSLVRIGEVFREAIRRNSAAIIVAHNHPSGDPSPSADDIALTRALTEAGKLLDISVLDHVVVGQGSYVSLRERGLM